MPELWAKGLRNPWGFWRDPVTGDLWISDVGEDDVEELNRIPATVAGANFGWYFVEGDHVRYQGVPADAVNPLFTYRHDQIGPAIIGGRVYRGQRDPGLDGAYVFADMAGEIFAMGAGDQVTPLTATLPQRRHHRVRDRPRRRAVHPHAERRAVQARAGLITLAARAVSAAARTDGRRRRRGRAR